MGSDRDEDGQAIRPLDVIVGSARVVGVGEAAHFVHEFNLLRARLVADLVERHGLTHLALEVGDDETAALQEWMRSPHVGLEELRTSVGPLTFVLYGTFLAELRARLGSACDNIGVLGVDLPNSLRLDASVGPLARLLVDVDPDGAASAEGLLWRCGPVTGGSAAASAFAWMAMPEEDRAAIGVEVARLRSRVNALQPLYEERASVEVARTALRLAESAAMTDLMLRAMADLLSGQGREADTSLRERFVAHRIAAALDSLPAEARIAYAAHNNHIQKAPVVFDGYLVALPAGSYLRRELGDSYVAIGLTHLDDHVPEMEVTASGALGFDVVRAAVAPPQADSVEACAAEIVDDGDGFIVVTPRDVPTGSPMPQTIRSQSAVSLAPLGDAFDAVVIVRSASTDAVIG